VIGGMLAGAFLGLFFVPLFFVLIQRVFGRAQAPAENVEADIGEDGRAVTASL
jgi:multidrug efflux pump